MDNKNKIIIIVLTILFLIILTRISKKILNKFAEKYYNRRIVIKNFIPLINILLYTGTIIIILFILKISSDALIAIGVSFGVTIGFASQNILANIFGGLIIVFTRPFNIGDKISVGDYYGEVIDVSLLKVKIQTPDDSVISVPSKAFIENQVSNANSGALDCQVVTEMMIPGNSDLHRMKRIALEAVYSSPYTFLKKPVVILFSDIYKETSMVRMKIKSYVNDHRFEFKYSSDIYERIKRFVAKKNLIEESFYRLAAVEKEMRE